MWVHFKDVEVKLRGVKSPAQGLLVGKCGAEGSELRSL